MIYDGRVRFPLRGHGLFEADRHDESRAVRGERRAWPGRDFLPARRPEPCAVVVGDFTVPCKSGEVRQEITVDNLQPARDYVYTVQYGG